MGRLHKIGNITIRVYANGHLPPHIHTISPEFEALILIACDSGLSLGKLEIRQPDHASFGL
jgi:hypothetical protein